MKQKKRSHAIIYAILFFILTISLSANADRLVTTRKHLKTDPSLPVTPQNPAYPPLDTIAAPRGIIRYCGYEKTIRATRETIFIENLTDSVIRQISFNIDYIDTSRRQIHRRHHRQPIEIPPRQTRRIDIPSWDTQKSYYYINGPRPKKSATPYDIRISTDTILLHHNAPH